MPILTQNHLETGMPAFQDHTSQMRFLGLKQAPVDARKKMKLASSEFKLVPESQWQPIDRRSIYGAEKWILDQQNHGSCVGYSAAGAEMIGRDLRGLTYARLSGSYIYSWINGGRDQGANIVDSLNTLGKYGTCLEVTCPVNSIYRAQSKIGDTEAKRFKIAYGLAVTSSDQASCWDWICSIIQQGGLAQFAIEVGNSFERFNADGVAGVDRGYGNHSVYADGMIKINSIWYLLMKNSWGFWGPFRNGYVLLSKAHIMGVVEAGGQDAYAHIDVYNDPQDPNNPVLPKA